MFSVYIYKYIYIYISLGSSTVQLRSGRACAHSEVGFNSRNGHRPSGVYYRRVAFSCRFFLWAKGLNAKDIHKEIIPIYGWKCLSRKAFHNWVAKFSQGRSKVADDARPGRPVEIATEATVQRASTHW
jgi:hypothetical protein